MLSVQKLVIIYQVFNNYINGFQNNLAKVDGSDDKVRSVISLGIFLVPG